MKAKKTANFRAKGKQKAKKYAFFCEMEEKNAYFFKKESASAAKTKINWSYYDFIERIRGLKNIKQ